MSTNVVELPFISELASRYSQVRESAACGYMPRCWAEVMQAIVDNLYQDRGENERLIAECIAIADEAIEGTREERQAAAAAKGCMDMTPLWSEALGSPQNVMAFVTGRKKKYRQGVLDELVRAGTVADHWLDRLSQVPVS